MFKTCTKCTQELAADKFYVRKPPRKALSSWCKACTIQFNCDKVKANPELAALVMREYNQKNRVQIAAKRKEYRKENLAAIKTVYAKWYQSDKSKELVRNAKSLWQKRHPDRVLASATAREKHVKIATPKWANTFFIAEAYNLAKVRKEIVGGDWHVDHIIPLRGKNVCGLHVEGNLQVIPAKTNLAKGNSFNLDNQ